MGSSFLFGEIEDVTKENLQRLVPPDQVKSLLQLFLLGRAADGILNLLQEVIAEPGLSPARMRILMVLRFQLPDGRATPLLLSEKVGVTKPTMTGFLNALERDRLILSVANEKDRRSVRIQLSPAGRAVVERVLPRLAHAAHHLILHLHPHAPKLPEMVACFEAALAAVHAKLGNGRKETPNGARTGRPRQGKMRMNRRGRRNV